MILCVKCQAAMQPKKTGVTVIETSGTPPKALRLWSADLVACPICGFELVTHYSTEPIVERHEAAFGKTLMAVTKEKRYVMYSPEILAQRVSHETKHLRKARSNGTN